ncbi:MAG: response regulator [Candidatus Hodarchaeota archaeon]
MVSKTSNNPHKVLIVDDERDIRHIFKIILEKKSYNVIEAPDGKAALEILEKDDSQEIIAVITDYLMPRMNGIELCKILRTDSRYKYLAAVILITAHLSAERFEETKCFDAKFTKPLNFNNFIEKMNACIIAST